MTCLEAWRCFLLPILIWGLLLVPITLRTAAATPQVIDDLDRQSLAQALARSLAYLDSLPSTARFNLGRTEVPLARLQDSARRLHDLAVSSLDETDFHRRLALDFELRPCLPSPESRLLVTGYYQPVFRGSLYRSSTYSHPLYGLPDDLVVKKQTGKRPNIGRLVGERLQPYWSRKEIEQGNILQGRELAWLRDPFDVFTLHVQGSGILRLNDGSLRGVHYAQSNGRPYTSIGKYLVATGRMQLAEVTMDSIRAYLEQHPEDLDLILHQNESFIFFGWSPPGPAVGSLNQPLTAGRSVAADQGVYPPGSIVFLKSQRPLVDKGQVVGWQPMQRLLTVQDTGAAIKGPGRLDIFWGTGDQAGLEAGQMKEAGEVAFLLLKAPAPAAP